MLLAEEEIARKDPKYRLKTINAETRDVLDTLEKEYKAPVCHSYICIGLDKGGYPVNSFLISHVTYVVVLIRTHSTRCF